MTWTILTLVLVMLWAAFWIPLLVRMATDRGWRRWQGALLGLVGPLGYGVVVAIDVRVASGRRCKAH